MNKVKVEETTIAPVARVFVFPMPGGRDERMEMRFSIEVPNLEKAMQAFAEAVWEGYDE